MLTKDIVNQLKAIHGKATKAKFQAAIAANWTINVSPSQYPIMIQGILSCLGLNFPDGYRLNSNTANAVHSKLGDRS